jgi:hypothetical protein
MNNVKLFLAMLFGISLLNNQILIAQTDPIARSLEVTSTTAKKVDSNNTIRVALLLDTSNSMDGLIDQAKAQLWDIVNELALAKCENQQPNLRIALYEYGNDGLPASEGYIRQVIGFSDDLDEISQKLFSLTTNGGNEFCGQVIQTSLKQLTWGNNPNDLKLMFIAGNEPFTQGTVSYQKAAQLANGKDVTINTIFCGDFETGIRTSWKNGADLTGGEYMAIDHNKVSVHIASPYDDAILKYNTKLNETYIPYGDVGISKMQNQRMQDSNAQGYSNANAVKRTISKSSHFYKNSSWDLVDAETEKGFKYEKIKKDQLPEALQDKSIAELKSIVQQKRAERLSIQEEINKLNAKRKVFVAEQKKLNNDINGLENAMINAIKKQAAEKNYKWKE